MDRSKIWQPRSSTAAQEEYLGRGWAFPIKWGIQPSDDLLPAAKSKAERFGVQMVTALEDIHQSITIILETVIGERVMRPDFGSETQWYVFAVINAQTMHNLGRDIRRALLKWERRIRDIEVEVTNSPTEQSRLDAEISFTIDTHRMRQSLIFPFYVMHPERA